MSSRRSCDACGKDMGLRSPEASWEHSFAARNYQHADGVTIHFKIYATTINSGPDVCKYCMIDAVKSMDDRPAEVEEPK